jgi:hypothetical protein
MNWHLFITIDVLKYSSGDTLHLPTNLLDGQSGNIAGNEQLAVPGVSFPDINWQGIFNFDIYQLGNYVSWGIINDKNIGYIYVYAWFTTKRPLSVDHYEITSSDSIPNPGDRLGFKIYLKNSGQTATIRNIEIKLTAIDTCAIPVESILSKTIDSLASKEIKTHNSIYTISINSACSGYIPVRVDMYEDAYLFWMDKFCLFRVYPCPCRYV